LSVVSPGRWRNRVTENQREHGAGSRVVADRRGAPTRHPLEPSEHTNAREAEDAAPIHAKNFQEVCTSVSHILNTMCLPRTSRSARRDTEHLPVCSKISGPLQNVPSRAIDPVLSTVSHGWPAERRLKSQTPHEAIATGNTPHPRGRCPCSIRNAPGITLRWHSGSLPIASDYSAEVKSGRGTRAKTSNGNSQ
jgi:hypothetical protein